MTRLTRSDSPSNTLPQDAGITGQTHRIESSARLPSVGEWYWVREAKGDATWFGCAVHVGSNFVEMRGPATGRSQYTDRIHFDTIAERLTLADDPQGYLRQKVASLQTEVADLMGQVNAITNNLGVAPTPQLESQQGSGNSLAVMSSQVDINSYKQALITAKKESLPNLFEAIRKTNETLAGWMAAEMIPLEAMAGASKTIIKGFEDRILNIELYSGLVENAEQFADGAPAPRDEKLRVFQRMLFCDEEALLGYRSGGMEITDLGDFQCWLAMPENRDRILPYPRCLVAMRVRRQTKDRDWGGCIIKAFRNMQLAQGDMKTFLFVRNGEQLYRISTCIEFDELIFPSKALYNPSEPMMVKMFGSKVDRMMPRREYDDRVREQQEIRARADAWNAENPRGSWEAANPGKHYAYANPHHIDSGLDGFSLSGWRPFDSSNVYFDEALASISDEIKKYNRIALIIQGLFDRSPCLTPHKPVRSWTPEGFAEAIELVYDGMGLTCGEPPSFEAYRQRCNALIDESSVLVGQEKAWMIREAQIECRRLDNNWRTSERTYRPTELAPYGDPGPGYLARPKKVSPRAGKATFTWHRERRGPDSWQNDTPVRCTITVPFDELLNVSAYQPGDFRQFFRDPRTREQYLQWAPMLIAAEDYHTKGAEVSEPVE